MSQEKKAAKKEKKVEIKYRDTEDGFKQDEKLRWPWLFFPFFCNATVFCSRLRRKSNTWRNGLKSWTCEKSSRVARSIRERLFLGSSYTHKKWLLHPVYMACPTNATPWYFYLWEQQFLQGPSKTNFNANQNLNNLECIQISCHFQELTADFWELQG